MMQLPAVTVYKLIASFKYPWLDELYTNNIPPEAITDGTKTLCLVQNIETPLTGYRNNKFSQLDANIAVQIFFSTDTDGSTLDKALQLVCDLQDNGWHVSAPYPDSVDPDTSQLTKTYAISKIIKID